MIPGGAGRVVPAVGDRPGAQRLPGTEDAQQAGHTGQGLAHGEQLAGRAGLAGTLRGAGYGFPQPGTAAIPERGLRVGGRAVKQHER